METTPIYSRPVRANRPDDENCKNVGVDPAAEAVKRFSAKYDKITPIIGLPRKDTKKTVRVQSYHEPDPVVSEDDSEITEEELMQVEAFFRSQQTQVYVCECLANLYHMTMNPSTDSSSNHGGGGGSGSVGYRCPSAVSTSSWSSGRSDSSTDSSTLIASNPEWRLALTGIPVLLFDRGHTRARNKRRLQIVLAERGSGFALWFDVVDNLSDYRSVAPTFHTMHYSGDHRQMVGFSFDRVKASADFYRRIEVLTSDPLNISLSVPKNRSTKRRTAKRSKSVGPSTRPASAGQNSPRTKASLPKKADISLPCCFQHVTSVELKDKEKLYSIATLVNSLRDTSLSSDVSLISRNASSLNNSPLRTKSSSDLQNALY